MYVVIATLCVECVIDDPYIMCSVLLVILTSSVECVSSDLCIEVSVLVVIIALCTQYKEKTSSLLTDFFSSLSSVLCVSKYVILSYSTIDKEVVFPHPNTVTCLQVWLYACMLSWHVHMHVHTCTCMCTVNSRSFSTTLFAIPFIHHNFKIPI